MVSSKNYQQMTNLTGMSSLRDSTVYVIIIAIITKKKKMFLKCLTKKIVLTVLSISILKIFVSLKCSWLTRFGKFHHIDWESKISNAIKFLKFANEYMYFLFWPISVFDLLN